MSDKYNRTASLICPDGNVIPVYMKRDTVKVASKEEKEKAAKEHRAPNYTIRETVFLQAPFVKRPILTISNQDQVALLVYLVPDVREPLQELVEECSWYVKA